MGYKRDTSADPGLVVELRRPTLPLFITASLKLPVGVLAAVLTIFLYLSSNHNQIFEPTVLSMSWFDRQVPFLPWTVWIYLSEYFLFAAAYFTAKDLKNINKMFYTFLAVQIISVTIFWVYPTTLPRDSFPLIREEMDFLTYTAFSVLRETDRPVNCAPSLHVSSCYVLSLLFLNEQREKFLFFFGWATLVAFSTLTTKQHYIIDIVTGLLLAGVCYILFYKFFRYRGTQAN